MSDWKHHRGSSVGLITALAFIGCLLLVGCDEPAADRPETKPDGYADATNVVVWRNADQIPNVAMFCADGLAWAATLSSDGTKTPNLVRVPERDARCGK